MRREILTFGKLFLKTKQCGIDMNVLKEGSGQPGLVESGKRLETWKLNLALKYGYTSHPSTPSLTGSVVLKLY